MTVLVISKQARKDCKHYLSFDRLVAALETDLSRFSHIKYKLICDAGLRVRVCHANVDSEMVELELHLHQSKNSIRAYTFIKDYFEYSFIIQEEMW